MAGHRFVVEGVREPAAADSPLRQAGAGDALLFAARLEATRTRDAAARASRDLVTPTLADDDLVEIAFDGGGHLWLSVAEFEAADFIDLAAPRSGAPKRVRARLVGNAATRGIGDTLIHALRFFRIDLPDRLACVDERLTGAALITQRTGVADPFDGGGAVDDRVRDDVLLAHRR